MHAIIAGKVINSPDRTERDGAARSIACLGSIFRRVGNIIRTVTRLISYLRGGYGFGGLVHLQHTFGLLHFMPTTLAQKICLLPVRFCCSGVVNRSQPPLLTSQAAPGGPEGSYFLVLGAAFTTVPCCTVRPMSMARHGENGRILDLWRSHIGTLVGRGTGKNQS